MDRMHFGQHSSSQFNEALESIRNHLMEMGGLVEKQVVDALEALLHADSALAEKVLTTEDRVDDLEIQIDEECARVLALRQPAASDLRLIIAVSKAVSDLERIGDESAKIAAMALQLAEDGESPRGYVEVRHIGNHVRNMLRDALDALGFHCGLMGTLGVGLKGHERGTGHTTPDPISLQQGLRDLLDWWRSLGEVEKASKTVISQLVNGTESIINAEQTAWTSTPASEGEEGKKDREQEEEQGEKGGGGKKGLV